jgi:hypothetical protein
MKKRLSTAELQQMRKHLKNLAIEDLVAILPATVIHESYPKRRNEGKSKTILFGLAFDESRIFSVVKRGMINIPKDDCSDEQARKFVERFREMLSDLRDYTDGKGESSRAGRGPLPLHP